MRRFALAIGIALLACLAVAWSATPVAAQDTDAPPRERPEEIDVDAPPPTEEELERDGIVLDDLDLSGAPGELGEPVAVEYEDDDFAPGLFIGMVAFMIIALFVAVVLLVVGTALLAAAIVITVGLGSAALVLGLASTSTFVGISRRSFGAGFEALLSQTGAILGLPCGVAAAWAAHFLAHAELSLDVSRNVALFLGGLSGLAAGAVLGMLTARSIRLTAAWAQRKLAPPTEPTAT